jgi:hypothetical protein
MPLRRGILPVELAVRKYTGVGCVSSWSDQVVAAKTGGQLAAMAAGRPEAGEEESVW